MPGLLLLHVRERRCDAEQYAPDVYVDHPVPIVYLEALERGVRHESGVVEQDVDAPVGLHGRIDELLDLLMLRHICPDRDRLAAQADELLRERLDAVDASRS